MFNNPKNIFKTIVVLSLLILVIQVLSNISPKQLLITPAAAPILKSRQPDACYMQTVRELTNCLDKPLQSKSQLRGNYWVLYNYVKAERTFKCHESVTYTTHADYSFIDNIVPLVEKWGGPVSVAMHAPGTDFDSTMQSIAYLRDCTSPLIKQLVTFHLYFSTAHVPKEIAQHSSLFQKPYACSTSAPFINVSSDQMYKTAKNLLYPINVGRNVARESAQTHFILASDCELYPSLNIPANFLKMIADNPRLSSTNGNPKVYPLHLFEVSAKQHVPESKSKLQEMLRNHSAIPFHKHVCPYCHNVPKGGEWQVAKQTEGLHVFNVGKRNGYFAHWEPIYIGTNNDPFYDERLSWEGQSDKMTQGYVLCVMDYDFLILDNSFLVHKPGIKMHKKDDRRNVEVRKSNQLISKVIRPELELLYGTRRGCQ